jgi:hypothetical protein
MQNAIHNIGLRYICHQGGTIDHIGHRDRWRGVAAGRVNLVHIGKQANKMETAP